MMKHIGIKAVLTWMVTLVCWFGLVGLVQARIGSQTVSMNSSSGLNAPEALWVGPTGDIYVMNTGTGTNGSRLNAYTPAGVTFDVKTFNQRPRGFAIDLAHDLIYMSQITSGSVITVPLSNLGATPTTVVTGLSSPYGIALNSDGSKLFVCNPGGSNVKIYNTSDMSLYATKTLSGNKIAYPSSIAMDSTGAFYVSDSRGTNIAAVTGNATVVKYSSVDATTNSVVVSGLLDNLNANTADSPFGVAVDAADNLYVLTRGSRAGGSGAVYKYSSTGTLIETIRPSTSTLNRPGIGIFVTDDYRIFVSDTLGNRVVYFTQSLDSPQNVTASVTGGNVQFSWTHIADTRRAGVTIRRGISGYPTSTTDGSPVASGITTTNYTDTVPESGTYYYTLFSINNDTSAGDSATLSVTIDITPPNPPELEASKSSPTGNEIHLSWTVPETTDHLELKRLVGSSETTVSENISPSVTSLVESGLEDGAYVYRLVAIDEVGNRSTAAVSATLNIDTVAPEAPSTLYTQKNAPNGSSVEITWDVPTGTATFLLQRSKDGADPVSVSSNIPVSTTSYTDTDLTDGDYVYSIYAIDEVGNTSNASVSATVNIDLTAPDAPSLEASKPTANGST
ncbi:MAG: hypothetical protein AB7F28_06695, partial [Candidatus Margulisiibacteriota bacterium]